MTFQAGGTGGRHRVKALHLGAKKAQHMSPCPLPPYPPTLSQSLETPHLKVHGAGSQGATHQSLQLKGSEW